MEEKLLNWIRNQQDVLDRLIADAATDFRTTHDYEGFIFDATMVSTEMWNLANGKDLCYDRPTIGFVYSLWYHAKRVNTFLRYYFHLILKSLKDDKIELFDLGAGTGAVQWAIGIVYAALKANNIQAPKFSIINIDTSPFMLQYNEQFLWKHFITQYPVCAEIQLVYKINSWVNEKTVTATNVWLTASYLFDHSENAKEIAEAFQNLAAVFEPSRLLLLSAYGKAPFVDGVATSLSKDGYEKLIDVDNSGDRIFHGRLTHVTNYREQLQREANYGFSGSPSWSIDSLYGIVLMRKQTEIFVKDRKKIDLYTMPERNRLKIFLTPQQRKAAQNREKPVIIIGPAGCGKSVVLTERVKNIVEDTVNSYNPELEMLVTTFNKDLTRQLGDWIEQLLDPERCARQVWVRGRATEPFSSFKFSGSAKPNIYLYHIDILPTKIAGLRPCDVTRDGWDVETYHLGRLASTAHEYAQKNKLDPQQHAKILDPIFLLEEFHRIIYGWQCTKESIYLEKERVGRGNNPTLKYGSRRRRIIWDIVYDYLLALKQDNLGSFTLQRHRMLRKLSQEGNAKKFDFILVDEIQDCTFADYSIFHHLLKPDGNLILAGDLAQSIHLGTSVHFPSSGFQKVRLKGSFRLPFLISSAIRPLSQAISSEFRRRKASGETDIILPYKGSPPGARPVIVYGKDLADLAGKIATIFKHYRIFDFDQIAVFEHDWELAKELSMLDVPCSPEIILKAKGLEKPCVLWSTRVGIDTKKDILEFVYTILTRTSSVLLIAICATLDKRFGEAIGYLVQDEEKIILWDAQTVSEIKRLKEGTFPSVEEEDIDDSEIVDLQTASASTLGDF